MRETLPTHITEGNITYLSSIKQKFDFCYALITLQPNFTTHSVCILKATHSKTFQSRVSKSINRNYKSQNALRCVLSDETNCVRAPRCQLSFSSLSATETTWTKFELSVSINTQTPLWANRNNMLSLSLKQLTRVSTERLTIAFESLCLFSWYLKCCVSQLILRY